jgi:hypothetical protein
MLAQGFEIDLRPVGLRVGVEDTDDLLDCAERVLAGSGRHHRSVAHSAVSAHHPLVMAHHFLHLVPPQRMLPGFHHLLLIWFHRMMLGRILGQRDARDRDGEHRSKGNKLTVGRHERTSSENLITASLLRPPRRMIEIM